MRETLDLDLREDLLQQHGFAHGGLLGYGTSTLCTVAQGTIAVTESIRDSERNAP